MRLTSIILLLILGVISSCQKGEDDPVFSLFTRKSRISVTWSVTKAESLNATITQNFDGTTLTTIIDDTVRATYAYEWEMSIDRQGVYVITQVAVIPEDTVFNRAEYTETTEEKGNWEFTGGNNSPSKSKLLLLKTERKITRTDQGSNVNVLTYAASREGEVYDIVGLSSEDMKLSYFETRSFGGGQEVNSQTIELKKN